MYSPTHAFPRFLSLPQEIRLLIWEQSIHPQLISITTQIFHFRPHQAPSFIYFLGGDPPYTHFTLNDQERPNEPYYTALSCPSQPCSPPLLSACRESRKLAFASGYVSWKTVNGKGEVRDLIWNPAIDVVYFVDDGSHDQFCNEICLFNAQFPLQTTLIQRLAVVSSWWSASPGTSQAYNHYTSPKTLLKFQELRELVVVVNEDIGREFLGEDAWESGGGTEMEQLNISAEIWRIFGKERELVGVLGGKEREWLDVGSGRESRIVLSEAGILGVFNLGLEITRRQFDEI